MAGGKKNRQYGDPEYESYVAAVKSDTSLTEAERQRFLSGEAAASLYRQEQGEDIKLWRGKAAMPDAFVGDAGLGLQISYFKKAYDKIKREKKMMAEKQKLLTDQPGLSTQSRPGTGTALSPGPTTALGGYNR